MMRKLLNRVLLFFFLILFNFFIQFILKFQKQIMIFLYFVKLIPKAFREFLQKLFSLTLPNIFVFVSHLFKFYFNLSFFPFFAITSREFLEFAAVQIIQIQEKITNTCAPSRIIHFSLFSHFLQ